MNAMLNSRMIGSAKLDFEGRRKARGFLEQAGYPSMKESYYVINNNICTITTPMCRTAPSATATW